MNGPIAQIVALTCHGSAVLSGHEVHRFFPANSTCAFCDRVTFVRVRKPLFGKPKEITVAPTPDEWFSVLRSSAALGIRLWRTPQNDQGLSDRMSAGFVGGGGAWSMEVLLPGDRSEHWVARWEVWNRSAPANRIWRVAYGLVSSGATRECTRPDLGDAGRRLVRALRDIHEFSTRRECGGFTQCFADALDTLDSRGARLHGYHKDLAPPGFLSKDAQSILDACQKAWVFGGMGSWNDLGFDGDDQREYERVSEQLFQAVNTAIASAGTSACYGASEADPESPGP